MYKIVYAGMHTTIFCANFNSLKDKNSGGIWFVSKTISYKTSGSRILNKQTTKEHWAFKHVFRDHSSFDWRITIKNDKNPDLPEDLCELLSFCYLIHSILILTGESTLSRSKYFGKNLYTLQMGRTVSYVHLHIFLIFLIKSSTTRLWKYATLTT